jgi:hypothetical protein
MFVQGVVPLCVWVTNGGCLIRVSRCWMSLTRCLCACVYVCKHAHKHTCIIHKYTYICYYGCTDMAASTRIHAHTHTHTHTQTIQTQAHRQTQAQAQAQAQAIDTCTGTDTETKTKTRTASAQAHTTRHKREREREREPHSHTYTHGVRHLWNLRHDTKNVRAHTHSNTNARELAPTHTVTDTCDNGIFKLRQNSRDIKHTHIHTRTHTHTHTHIHSNRHLWNLQTPTEFPWACL